VVNVFSDEQSGKTDKRPGFMDLMDAIDEGKVNAIVCLHLDRFSRDIHDILKYFHKLEKDGVFMAFADEHFDFSTPEGKMHFHFLAVFADWYIKNLSLETKRGKKNVITEGRQNNQVPFGYCKLPDEKVPAQMMFEWIEIDVRKSRLRYVSPKRGFQIFFDKHPMMRKDEERGGYRVVNLP
jgi:site-specific DNA recombinase